MKLYKLERAWNNVGYDQCHAFVVRAKSPASARKIAANACADEGRAVWLSAAKSTCAEVTDAGEEGVICVAFRAG